MKILKNDYVIKAFAILILIFLYMAASLPKLDADKAATWNKQFNFDITEIDVKDKDYKKIRKVHPSYQPIDAWISSVGSAATFTDLFNSGQYSDLILTEPRTDKVYVLKDAVNRILELSPDELNYDSKTMAPMGTLTHDFDENGKMDILVYYWGRTPIIFYQNEDSFKATELTNGGHIWNSNTGTLADINGDGHTDIIIGNYFPDGGEVLNESGKNKEFMQHSMSRADNGAINRLFLFDKNAASGFTEHTNWLDGIETPLDWTLAIAAGDINGDLLPEIYFANDFGPDKLLLNKSSTKKVCFSLLKGVRGLTTMASEVLGKDSFKGMGADFCDVNRDGLIDIYVSNIADEYALEESHFLFLNNGNLADMDIGKAPFVNKSEKLGLSRSSWGWDCKLADFNNDGKLEAIQATGFIKGETNRWPELHEVAMGNDELLSSTHLWHKLNLGDDLSGHDHNPFFVQDENGYFFDLASELGIDQPQVSRGLAVSDIDHDGDLDFVCSNQWAPSRLYTNNLDKKKHKYSYIGMNIRRSFNSDTTTVDNSIKNGIPAVGCRIEVLSIDGVELAPDQRLISYVHGGNGHSGMSSNEVYFGLGKTSFNARIIVELDWLDSNGSKQKEKLQLSTGWHYISLKNNS